MHREDEYIPVTIHKPLPGGKCSIDFRVLQRAVTNHQLIKLTLVGYGTGIIDPRVWYETATEIEKRKVRYSTPMTFVYNRLKIDGTLTKTKGQVEGQMTIL